MVMSDPLTWYCPLSVRVSPGFTALTIAVPFAGVKVIVTTAPAAALRPVESVT
jgi:hypothetical protein